MVLKGKKKQSQNIWEHHPNSRYSLKVNKPHDTVIPWSTMKYN